jgi:hypothetical protein
LSAAMGNLLGWVDETFRLALCAGSRDSERLDLLHGPV